jgi:hypothetical protein
VTNRIDLVCSTNAHGLQLHQSPFPVTQQVVGWVELPQVDFYWKLGLGASDAHASSSVSAIMWHMNAI